MKFFYILFPLLLVFGLIVYSGEEITTLRVVVSGEQEITTSVGTDSIIILGGTLHLTPEASVTKTLYVIDGEVFIDGEVENIIQLGGHILIKEQGVVSGTVSVFSGTFESVNSVETEEVQQYFARLTQQDSDTFTDKLRTALIQLAVVLLAAFLVSSYLPSILSRSIVEYKESFSINLAYGILLLVVTPPVLFILIYTGILIPIAVLLLVISAVTALLAYILLGATIGTVILNIFHKPAVSIVYSTCIGVTFLHVFVYSISILPLLTLLVVGTPLLASVGQILRSRFGFIST